LEMSIKYLQAPESAQTAYNSKVDKNIKYFNIKYFNIKNIHVPNNFEYMDLYNKITS